MERPKSVVDNGRKSEFMEDIQQLSVQNQVFRTGKIIRRPAGEWSPSVHRLLLFLEEKGIQVPHPLGIENGQEMLTFVEGEFVHPYKWTDEALFAVGEMVARLHRAARDFSGCPEDKWKPWYLREIGKNPPVYGHGDIAPWNMVTENGIPKALIDWEYAGPIDPVVELCRVCWLFPQLVDDDLAALYDLPDAQKRAEQVRMICDGYGLSRSQRHSIVEGILELIICETAHEAIDPGLTFESNGSLWGFAWRSRSLYWIWRNRKVLEEALI